MPKYPRFHFFYILLFVNKYVTESSANGYIFDARLKDCSKFIGSDGLGANVKICFGHPLIYPTHFLHNIRKALQFYQHYLDK